MTLNWRTVFLCLRKAGVSAGVLARRRPALLLTVLVVGIASVLGVGKFVNNFAFAATPAGVDQAPPKDVHGTFRPSQSQWKSLNVETVRSTVFQSERVTDGTIAVNDDATTPVFSPYSGRVAKLFAKPGDVVKRGAPLMAVEASEYVQAQNDLIIALAAHNTARAQTTLAQTTELRQHDLYLAQAGARKDWEQSVADLASARNARTAADMTLAAVRNRLRILGKSDAEISVLERSPVTQKLSPVAIVSAPISGTVTQRQVGLGQYITSAAGGAAPPQFAISDLSTVWLIANVRETDAPLMRVGLPVVVRVAAYPERVFHATITWIAASIDPATHRLPVRAEIKNPGGMFKPMMFASITIATGDSVTAPGIPESAIVYEGDETHVFVARNNGTAVLRMIRTGRSNNGMVEVSSGLTPGEKIITRGTLFIDRAAQGD